MFQEFKIELKAVIELDAPTYMNLNRFLERMMEEHGTEMDRKDLGKFLAEMRMYELEGY